MIPNSIATRGHNSLGLGTGVGPGRPRIELIDVSAGQARFKVYPPTDPTYAGTMIQFAEVDTSVYSEAGPEDVNDIITVTGLVSEIIYSFVPYAYDGSGAWSKPGNVILANAPINVVDMDQLHLNSCAMRCLWEMINRKVDKRELTASLDRMVDSVRGMVGDRSKLDVSLEILEREIAILRRKIGS